MLGIRFRKLRRVSFKKNSINYANRFLQRKLLGKSKSTWNLQKLCFLFANMFLVSFNKQLASVKVSETDVIGQINTWCENRIFDFIRFNKVS